MEFVPLFAFGTLVYMLVNFLKYVASADWKSVTTQVIAWTAGIVGIFVMGATQFADGVNVGGTTLDKLNGWSKVLVGLLAVSLLSAGNDLKKAIDNKDTAKVPSWPAPTRLFRKPSSVTPAAATPAAASAAITVPAEWVEEVRHTVKQ